MENEKKDFTIEYKVEPVDAYKVFVGPEKKATQDWSCHAYVAYYIAGPGIDKPRFFDDIDLRHVRLKMTKKGWMILVPTSSNWDEEEKKNVRFPIYDRPDPVRKKEFLNALRGALIPYVQKKILEDEGTKVVETKDKILSNKILVQQKHEIHKNNFNSVDFKKRPYDKNLANKFSTKNLTKNNKNSGK